MRSEVEKLSTYVSVGKVASEEEAFELEKNLYCFGIPVRTVVDALSGETEIYTFEKYRCLVSGVIDNYKKNNYVLEHQALERMMHEKTGFSPAVAKSFYARPKMKRGAALRLAIISILILVLMVLFKQL